MWFFSTIFCSYMPCNIEDSSLKNSLLYLFPFILWVTFPYLLLLTIFWPIEFSYLFLTGFLDVNFGLYTSGGSLYTVFVSVLLAEAELAQLPDKMAKFVPDVTTNRWVIIAEGRSKRPQEVKKAPGVEKICVFCPGFEKIPGEELYRIGPGAPYEPGWQVRVIKNKYPITDFHEVIIHSPDDKLDIDRLPLEQVHRILLTYRERYNENAKNGHVLIFNNVG